MTSMTWGAETKGTIHTEKQLLWKSRLAVKTSANSKIFTENRNEKYGKAQKLTVENTAFHRILGSQVGSTSYTCHSMCERGHYDADCDFADAASAYECAINCGSTCIPCSPGRASSVSGAGFNTTCEVVCLP